MKYVIDIDEDYIKIINKNGGSNYTENVIQNATPLEKVLEDIKAEIEQYREEEPHLCDYRYHRNEGLDMALDIIDKPIKE